MTLIISLVITVLLLIFSIVINVFIYKSLKIQLKNVENYKKALQDSDEWASYVRNYVRITYMKMKELDNREIFSKDDEVGVSFTDLLDLLKKLNDRVQ